MSDNQHLIEGVEPKYYARIPNMVIDDLPYAELALYVHYKRIASDQGKCWQSTATIAKALKMTIKKLRATRDTLAKRGLILVTLRQNEDGVEHGAKIIRILDIWQANVERFTPSPENDLPPGRKRPTPRSKTTHEEKPIKKNQEKEKDSPATPGDAPPENQPTQTPSYVCPACQSPLDWCSLSQSYRCENCLIDYDGYYNVVTSPTKVIPEDHIAPIASYDWSASGAQSTENPSRLVAPVVVHFNSVKEHWDADEQTWDDPRYEYIGRPISRYNIPGSFWKNPHRLDEIELREDAIVLYRQYLEENLWMLERLSSLTGKILVCWLSCHGDVLVELWWEHVGNMPGSYTAAKGALAGLGDEPAEDMIRQLRDDIPTPDEVPPIEEEVESKPKVKNPTRKEVIVALARGMGWETIPKGMWSRVTKVANELLDLRNIDGEHVPLRLDQIDRFFVWARKQDYEWQNVEIVTSKWGAFMKDEPKYEYVPILEPELPVPQVANPHEKIDPEEYFATRDALFDILHTPYEPLPGGATIDDLTDYAIEEPTEEPIDQEPDRSKPEDNPSPL